MHPAGGATPLAPVGVRPPHKICGVCGERAKSHHFGGMACDSCKAFFRRSVQSEACSHFRCSYEGCCHISITTRKCCQFCRFQKCLKIGMEKKWVMSEEERAQQDKIRKERKRQRKEEEDRRKCRVGVGSSGVPSPVQEPPTPPPPLQITEQDRQEIEQLINKFHASYSSVPLDPEAPPESRPPTTTRVVGVFVNAVSRLVSFIASLPHFSQLPVNDQKILLKNGVLAVLILRGTMVYDSSSTVFNARIPGAKVGMSDIKSVMTPNLMENHRVFVERMQGLGVDKTTNMLLQMVVMFSSDLPGLIESEMVSRLQDHYTCLLHRYMRTAFGEDSTRLVYPRMLHLLADLRALVEAHNMNTVCFPDSDLASVVQEFGKIDLNPYPMWPDFAGRRGEEHERRRRRREHHHHHQHHYQQSHHQHQPRPQPATNEWRRGSLPDFAAAAITSSAGCSPMVTAGGLGPGWPAHSPSPAHSAGASPHYPALSALGAGPQSCLTPQTPADFRSAAGGPLCMRDSPPSGGLLGATGPQCMRKSPPAGAQFRAFGAGGLDASPQNGSPSPGVVPAHWPAHWGSEPFGAAGGAAGPFGEARSSRPPTASRSPHSPADCLRLPPGGDLANCAAPELDLSAILELGPSLQALEPKLPAEAAAWSPPSPGGLPQYLPHHYHQHQQQQELLHQLGRGTIPPQQLQSQPAGAAPDAGAGPLTENVFP